MTIGVSSPAIFYMLGIMSSKPCDDVKVVVSEPVCNAPCTAPAAPPSLCISTTEGTVPQMFGFPADDQASADSPMGDEGVMG
jgi:hypothetical protein